MLGPEGAQEGSRAGVESELCEAATVDIANAGDRTVLVA